MVEPPIWSPSPARIAAANLSRFAAFAHAEHGAPAPTSDPVADHRALWQWSIDERARFWVAVYRFCGIVGERPEAEREAEVLSDGERMPGAHWFTGTRLNFAENLLQRRDAHPALIFVNEGGDRRLLTYADLHARSARLAAGLRAEGVGPGDRVAGFLPNIPEAVIGMLATASLGATWTSCSPDFGINGVLDRFGQVQPKVLLTADGYYYNGKRIDSLTPISAVVNELPSV